MPCRSPKPNVQSAENAFYIAVNLENILYGIELVLYFKTIYIFLARRKKRQKLDICYGIFSSVMLILVTYKVASTALLGQRMWLMNQNRGPSGYAATRMPSASGILNNIGLVILQLMTDGLMVYRCQVVWASIRIIIIPSFLWLTTLALGIAFAWTANERDMGIYTGITAKLGLAYYSASVLLNVILTCMICYRLVSHAKTVKAYIGKEYASWYFKTTVLLVESVLPYTLAGIAFLVSYGLGSPLESIFRCVYMLMMCISPQALILQAAERHARRPESERLTIVSSITFSRRRRPSECFDAEVEIDLETQQQSGESNQI